MNNVLITHFMRCIGLVFLVLSLQACSSRTVLFSGLEQDEGNEIYAAIVKAGIPAEKSRDKQGIAIAVPENLASDALKILQAQGLPRDKRTTIGEVFKKEGMISSPWRNAHVICTPCRKKSKRP